MHPLLVVVFRAFITFFFLIILLRTIGYRQISQLTFKDYVIGICIGSISGRAITKLDEPYVYFGVAFLTLTVTHLMLSYLNLKNDTIRRLVNGEPIILIYNGQIIKRNLKKSKMSIDGLASLLREKNIFKLSDVEYALLEPLGEFSVLLKSDKKPLTPMDMNIQSVSNGLPVFIIKEGKLVTKDLHKYNLTKEWVNDQLTKNKISDISQVLLAQADKSGIIYICLYDTNNISN